jgi:hypothetical protein
MFPAFQTWSGIGKPKLHRLGGPKLTSGFREYLPGF